MSDILEKLSDSAPNGKANLRVHLVVPPTGDNPWRTLSDYEQDQKEARERHEWLQEQHKILQRSFRLNIVAVVAAILAAVAALVSAYFAAKDKAVLCTHTVPQQIQKASPNKSGQP